MRLVRVRGRHHRLKQRLLLGVIRTMSRHEPVDVLKTLLYRPEFFGAPFSAATQAALRGPSAWSVGERELMAAYVSRLNRCRF